MRETKNNKHTIDTVIYVETQIKKKPWAMIIVILLFNGELQQPTKTYNHPLLTQCTRLHLHCTLHSHCPPIHIVFYLYGYARIYNIYHSMTQIDHEQITQLHKQFINRLHACALTQLHACTCDRMRKFVGMFPTISTLKIIYLIYHALN